MTKREFLRTSAAIAAGGVLSPLISSCAPSDDAAVRAPDVPHTNWARNLTYGTDQLFTPHSVAEAQDVVRRSTRIRPLGTRHCFNTIADSTDGQISMTEMNQVVALDAAARSVTVEAGVNYGGLSTYLHDRGFAVHNLASLPHISVVGACATSTHGSGVANGSLATSVSAIEFIDAAGDLRRLSRASDPDRFPGAVVGLGALGVVTQLTLDVEPTFDVRQFVYLDLPLDAAYDHFHEVMSSAYSVSLFADYQADRINQVWVKDRIGTEETFDGRSDFFGARPADRNVHPIIELSAENCTEQMGVPGPWYDRLPHFRMGFTPSSGEELQTEYFVHRDDAAEVLRVLHGMGDLLGPLLQISEIRTIAEDDLWMSMFYDRPSVAFHFTWRQDWDLLQRVLPDLDAALAPFEPRPHWGKNFGLSPSQIRAGYERLPDFLALVHAYDPEGKFRNEFLEENLFA